MAGKGKGKRRFTALQLEIIEKLTDGLSQAATAEQLGCSPKTVCSVYNDPDIKVLYFQRCADKVQGLVPVAIKRLADILADDEVQPSVHIAAVREVLDRANLEQFIEEKKAEPIKVEIEYI